MQVIQKKLGDLHKLEMNIRRHTPKQLSEYVRSVRMFGQIRPLVVDDTGAILAGNGLYDALLSIGAETADCYVMSGLSENDKKKLMLADNRVYELGMTDAGAFEEIIRSLGGDVDVPGWDADLLETLNASVQEVNEMVNSYGSFEPEEIARVNARQERPSAAPQPVSGSLTPSGQADTYPQAETPPQTAEAAGTRYVICPKCGERIAIGGV